MFAIIVYPNISRQRTPLLVHCIACIINVVIGYILVMILAAPQMDKEAVTVPTSLCSGKKAVVFNQDLDKQDHLSKTKTCTHIGPFWIRFKKPVLKP